MNYDGGNPGMPGQGNPGSYFAWMAAIKEINAWFTKFIRWLLRKGTEEKSEKE